MSAILKRAHRATFYLIALLMGLSLFAPIVALGNDDLLPGDTATVATGGGEASIRDAASATGQSIGSVPDGTDIYIIAGPTADTDGSLWYQAGVWDITGYINASLLADVDAPVPADEEDTPAPSDEAEAPAVVEDPVAPAIPWQQPIDYGVVVDNNNASLPGDGLACRMDASGAAETVARFGLGQSVEVTGDALWAEGVEFLPVNCAGQGGFVKADYVTLSSDTVAEPEVEAAVEPEATEEVAAGETVAEEPVADEAAAGDLIVRVSDENGAPVTGLCFQLFQDGAWVADACDGNDAIPDNGNSGFFGIDSGEYMLVPSSVPEGVGIDTQHVSILAGNTGSISVAVDADADADAGNLALDVDVDVDVEQPVVAEEPVATEDSVEAEVPDVSDDAAATDEPVVTEEPVITEEPVVTEEPVATEEPVVTQEPVVSEELTVTAEAEASAQAAEPTEVPVVTEETIVSEEVEATEESIVTEGAEATEEPVATGEADGSAMAGLDLSQAIGDATVTGTNGEGVRCRVSPDASAATITVLEEGATVFVLEYPSNGYVGVACGDQIGYADLNYMYSGGAAGDPVPASASSVTVVGTGGMPLNCRSGAGSNFGVVTSVPAGSVLTSRGASTGGWAPVVCGGMNGFVSISFIEVSGSSSGGNTGATGGSTTGSGTISNTGGDGVRCRTAPNGSVIMVLAEGTRVTTRGAASGGWLPVVCGGMNGFVSSSFITLGSGSGSGTTAPTPTPAPGGNTGGGASSGNVRVTGTGGASLNCRSAASSTGMVITSVPANSTLAVRGAAVNGWQPVTCAGKSGYVSANYVTATSDSVTPTPGTSNPGTGQTGSAVVSNAGGGGVYCRTAPGGSPITVVAEGTSVGTRGASSNGWTPVVCGGRNGFMSSQFLSTGGATNPSPTPTPNPGSGSGTGSGLVNGDRGKVNSRANMRYQASLSAAVMTIVEPGEVLLITGGATNGFYPVNYDGLRAFMATELLTKTTEALSKRGGSAEPAPQPEPNLGNGGGSTATGSAIVNYAMRYVGYPYVSATAGPSSFDCSGFTNWVIKNVVGPDIGRGLWTQWASGTAIGRSSLQPGDLVFFQNTYKAGLSHVGIYIGNNQFVHAENATTGVRVSDLTSNYYSSRYLGARRIN